MHYSILMTIHNFSIIITLVQRLGKYTIYRYRSWGSCHIECILTALCRNFFWDHFLGKAYSDIRQKEVISGRFPITKSELALCCLRDEGPIYHIRPAKQSRNEHLLRFRSWLRISVKIFAFFSVAYQKLQKISAMPPFHGWPITTTTYPCELNSQFSGNS